MMGTTLAHRPKTAPCSPAKKRPGTAFYIRKGAASLRLSERDGLRIASNINETVWMDRALNAGLPGGENKENGPLVCQDRITLDGGNVVLGADASRIMNEPNAGGKSTVSEALSMELLQRRFGAHDVLTEMEIVYWNDYWKKVDYIATLKAGGHRVGVSVTRAFGWRDSEAFCRDDADRLLAKKLRGLVVARMGLWDDSQVYDRSILHVWCQTQRIADLIWEAFADVEDETIKANVIVLCTVADTVPQVFSDDASLIA